MNESRYVPVRRRARQEIVSALSNGNAQEIRDALISAAYWEDDWRWAQEQLLRFAEHESDLVKWAVATGFGFIAVFNGEIDEAVVGPVIAQLKRSHDKFAVAAAEDAEADIAHFVKARRKGKKVTLARRLPEDWSPPVENS
jgi:hypothetical protein